ncbi:MAG: TorF family putative porin [Candidatus Sumerlaeia bacterium]
MRKAAKVTLVVMALFVLCMGAMAQDMMEGEDNPFGASASVDFYSKYIWRGWNVTDNEVVQPAIEATMEAGPVGFLASAWANYDTAGEHDFTEIDLTAEASVTVAEMVSVAMGYIYYRFPQVDLDDGENDAVSTSELYASISAEVPASEDMDVELESAVYRDRDDGDGYYYVAGVSTAIPIAQEETVGVTLDPSVSIGFNDQQWGADSSWADMLMVLGATVSLGDYFSFGPSLNYSYALDTQYDDWFFYGINVSAAY